MSASSIRNQIGVYFGGTYDTTLRSYRSPQVSGLGVVRRSRPKNDDHADYYLGMAAGTAHGSMMIVWVHAGPETRLAVAGPSSGIKRVGHRCLLQVLVRSTAGQAEDAEDYTYTLRDALTTRIRADRMLGSGGFEAGGFQVGEGSAIDWNVSPAHTNAGLTKLAMSCEFTAVELVYA